MLESYRLFSVRYSRILLEFLMSTEGRGKNHLCNGDAIQFMSSEAKNVKW